VSFIGWHDSGRLGLIRAATVGAGKVQAAYCPEGIDTQGGCAAKNETRINPTNFDKKIHVK